MKELTTYEADEEEFDRCLYRARLKHLHTNDDGDPVDSELAYWFDALEPERERDNEDDA